MKMKLAVEEDLGMTETLDDNSRYGEIIFLFSLMENLKFSPKFQIFCKISRFPIFVY